ncbi:IclR family transcriptional regulator [Prauserella shujinwangii]|uniref:IclR family transcriptional regulator n=1 Tax=Prauserella shujinwangii TaxID=1453103 RepID=A0A2T0LKJ3_9PSEU|nr:IclR family transcriptional regulator [Prauserella shujinwangii]
MKQPTPGVNTTGTAYSQTLGRGLRVLELLRAHPDGLGVHAVAERLDLHRTVVYRLLGTLRAHGLVMQGEGGRYRLGAGLLALAGGVRADLRAAAEPRLGALAEKVGATAFLTLAEGDEAVNACAVEPRHARLHVGYRVGVRHALTVSAAGLAILAARPPVAGERAAVTRARARGYAVTSGELEPGAWGLAAPLPAAGVAASVGVVALTELAEAGVARAVLDTARAIATDL